MDLLLSRFSSGDESTLGLMFDASGNALRFLCFGLEDQFNDPKIPGETRIPSGRYRIELRAEGPMHDRYAERFNFHRGMLWLQDVPDFTYVYIHVGNDDDETEGCILVGDGAQSNVVEDGKVLSSVSAYTRLYRRVLHAINEGEEIWIEVGENY